MCANTLGSYTCTCKENFEGNGTVCTEINPCEKDKGGCNSLADCKFNRDKEGSERITCTCNDDYTKVGDGKGDGGCKKKKGVSTKSVEISAKIEDATVEQVKAVKEELEKNLTEIFKKDNDNVERVTIIAIK